LTLYTTQQRAHAAWRESGAYRARAILTIWGRSQPTGVISSGTRDSLDRIGVVRYRQRTRGSLRSQRAAVARPFARAVTVPFGSAVSAARVQVDRQLSPSPEFPSVSSRGLPGLVRLPRAETVDHRVGAVVLGAACLPNKGRRERAAIATWHTLRWPVALVRARAARSSGAPGAVTEQCTHDHKQTLQPTWASARLGVISHSEVGSTQDGNHR